jgi:hypothetical protein
VIFKKSLGHFQPLEVSRVYEFIRSEEDYFPYRKQCEVLRVSRSGYYARRQRKTHQCSQTEKKGNKKIIDTFHEYKRRYGSRRISKSFQVATGVTCLYLLIYFPGVL